MNRARGFLCLAVFVFAALPSAALDFLSPEEQAEVELKRKREAEPVLACTPLQLTATVRQDETTSLRLTVLNAGGRTLHWSVESAPKWALPEARSGKLNFEEKQDIVLLVNPSTLPERTVKGEIVIEAPDARKSPVRVAIFVEVLPVPRPEPPVGPAIAEPEPAPVEPEPAKPAGPPKEEPAERRLLGLGVRGGVMVPGAEEKEGYSAGPLLGLFWRPGRDGSRFGYELEIGFGQTGSDSGLEESTLVEGRASALWHMVRNEVLSAYALGGLGLVSETVEDEELGTSSTLGSSLDFGLGVTVSGIDARVTYSILLGSENVGGALGASLGYAF